MTRGHGEKSVDKMNFKEGPVGNEAINVGARVGNDALKRIATQAKIRIISTGSIEGRPNRG
jgi:hypothetical protein